MDILGFEDPVLDEILNIDRLPQPDGYATLANVSRQGGGRISTALCAAAACGMRTALVGRVGQDEAGDFLLADLAFNQVDTTLLRRDTSYATPRCFVLAQQETGCRAFLGAGHLPDRPESLPQAALAEARILHLDHFDAGMRRMAALVRQKRRLVSLDADFPHCASLADLAIVDIVICSARFFDALLPGASPAAGLRKLRQQGPRIAIVTRGEAGCWLDAGEGCQHIPAFSAPVVDTTGAGDTFHGVFLAYLLLGEFPVYCARMAAAAAAIQCTRPGGRAGLPDKAAIERFCQDGQILGAGLAARAAFYGL